jgi:hypothetical protein
MKITHVIRGEVSNNSWISLISILGKAALNSQAFDPLQYAQSWSTWVCSSPSTSKQQRPKVIEKIRWCVCLKL